MWGDPICLAFDLVLWAFSFVVQSETLNPRNLPSAYAIRIQLIAIRVRHLSHPCSYDVCPGGPYGPNPEGRLEVHISGDIAFAVRQYWEATGVSTGSMTDRSQYLLLL